jgi:hypothetical protein
VVVAVVERKYQVVAAVRVAIETQQLVKQLAVAVLLSLN